MWVAVCTSCSVPDSIACSAVSDSLTPPAHDWMSDVMSCRNVFTSAARCDRVG